jgi:serine phosphatase RsbU (regulator of sigma subunit)
MPESTPIGDTIREARVQPVLVIPDVQRDHGSAGEDPSSAARDSARHVERRLQRTTTLQARRLSEELQRSLLTRPTTPTSLQIAVRYHPAVVDAKIGGDWYDAFVNASGATILVIGDVTGHDRMAAAAMGQLRNMLRGIAYESNDGPAALLSRLDRAMAGLEVDVIASAIVAIVEPSRSDRRPGRIRLRWSNAGHPAPLLRYPDGLVRILSGANDLLLGVEPTTTRIEQVVELAQGSTVLLYTDGLVERRGTDYDDRVQRVAGLMRDMNDASAEDLCDTLINATSAAHTEDDVALLALQCRPLSRPLTVPQPRTGIDRPPVARQRSA